MEQSTTARDWRAVLREQGRTITWLAKATGRPRATVYRYNSGLMTATDEWLAKVSEALGEPVIDVDAPWQVVRRERAS